MSDIELTSQNYFVGPKTEDRICSHTIAIFKMLNGIIMEVNEISLKLQKILFFPIQKIISVMIILFMIFFLAENK